MTYKQRALYHFLGSKEIEEKNHVWFRVRHSNPQYGQDFLVFTVAENKTFKSILEALGLAGINGPYEEGIVAGNRVSCYMIYSIR